jgi:hypothetical protein
MGKSLLTVALASWVSSACAPGDLLHTAANVLIASAEDDPEDTIKPRLIAASAVEAHVHLMDVREDDEHGVATPGIVQLPGDASAIHRAVRETGARLVVLDPVAAFLDADHSAYREQEVRAALAPLKTMAEQEGCAVIAVMHLNKAEGEDPLRRIANSGAFTALARSVLLFGRDPEDEDGERGSRRVLAVVKGNVTAAAPGATLRVESREVTNDEGEVLPTAALEVIGRSAVSADDLLGGREERGAQGEAMTWLRDLLSEGPVASADVRRAVDEAEHSWSTVRRAKAALSVRSVKRGQDEGWVWILPDDEPTPDPANAPEAALDAAPPVPVGPLGHLEPLPENKGAKGWAPWKGRLDPLEGAQGAQGAHPPSRARAGGAGSEQPHRDIRNGGTPTLLDVEGSEEAVVRRLMEEFDATELTDAEDS